MDNQKACVLQLARALATFGAPTRSIETRLDSIAKRLDLPAIFIRLPNGIVCDFGDKEKSETHFIKRDGHLSLRNLRKVDLVYTKLVLDPVPNVERASKEIEEVLLGRKVCESNTYKLNRVIKSPLLIPYLIRGTPGRK